VIGIKVILKGISRSKKVDNTPLVDIRKYYIPQIAIYIVISREKKMVFHPVKVTAVALCILIASLGTPLFSLDPPEADAGAGFFRKSSTPAIHNDELAKNTTL